MPMSFACGQHFSGKIMANDVTEEIGSELLIDVDKVLKTKAPRAARWLPRFVVRYLKHIIHQDEVNRLVQSAADVVGLPFTDVILKEFGVEVDVEGLERVSPDGRYIFASNHPLGGLDGIALLNAVGKRFSNIKFPVNDILLFVKNFHGIFLPVNKVGTTGRRSAQMMEEAFASDCQMLMFPAGLCSRKRNGMVADLEWKKGFITKAVECQRDIVPVHITGRNSNFFYNLSRVRNALGIKVNIEMLYLVDEMYRQKGNRLTIKFGQPISWHDYVGRNAKHCAQEVKKIVYSMQ